MAIDFRTGGLEAGLATADMLAKDAANLPAARLLKGGLYASVQRYETAPEESKAWETHQVYADIQFIASGRERILYAPVESFQPTTPYNPAKDVQKYDGAGVSNVTSMVIPAGSFAVYLPQDGHKPGCQASDRPEPVVKVVIKVRLKD